MDKQMILYVDTRRCMGCRACETVCKLENNLDAGPRFTMVTEVETGSGNDERLNSLSALRGCALRESVSYRGSS